MNKQFLTQAGFNKLQDELNDLRTNKRTEVAQRLREAVEDGELLENAEYEAAKNEQAFTEGRIQELEIILAGAKIIDGNGNGSDTVQLGSKVTIQEEGEEPEVYTVVGPAEASPSTGYISFESPLGAALMDAAKGDEIEVPAPAGSFNVKIIKVG
ncbi:MAG: transcription elongation factor GreA [Anaerolineaceae bacterium]|nr:transcription elongation factor GreA [Anaerolineaceae bacterium]